MRRYLAAGIFIVAIAVGSIFYFRSHIHSNLEATYSNKLKGDPNAPVEIIEYANFECHSCHDIQPFIAEILKKYPGNVKLAFRHYPSYRTQHSFWSHVAAECAAQRGIFWPYHDKLFEHQREWSASPEPWKYFVQYAKELGIDEKDFVQCSTSESIAREVHREDDSGLKLGLKITPSFVVNGQILVGTRAFKETIDSRIQSALEKKGLS